MDTLSSSVSTLKVPSLHSTSREFYHFKSYLPSHPHLSSTTKPNSLSNKTTTSFTHKTFTSPFISSSQTLPLTPPSPTPHQKPASGYAAALVDIAQCNSTLSSVQKDVQGFLKLLRNEQIRAVLVNPLLGEKEKGQVVRLVAEKGRFNRHLVRLVKMLVEKNKVGTVKEVLDEFERIYDELSGTQVVLVSSAAKMEEDQLAGIAKRVQKLSGAVKVKVRNLVHESLPSLVV